MEHIFAAQAQALTSGRVKINCSWMAPFSVVYLNGLWRIRLFHNPGCGGREVHLKLFSHFCTDRKSSWSTFLNHLIHVYSTVHQDSLMMVRLKLMGNFLLSHYCLITSLPPFISFPPLFISPLIPPTSPPLIKYSESLALGQMPPSLRCQAGSQLPGHVARWGGTKGGDTKSRLGFKMQNREIFMMFACFNEPSYFVAERSEEVSSF